MTIEGIEIHNYVLIEKLGEGAFARVYKAKHKTVDKLVAIKVVKCDQPNTLKHESRILHYLYRRRIKFITDTASLENSNMPFEFSNGVNSNSVMFPVVHWYGRYGDLLCLATTYYMNDLQGFLKNAHASLLQDAFQQMIQLCKMIHDVGIIHGDIKPANYMINDMGYIVLVDFGMARSIDFHNEKWASFFGTPKYASPFVHSGYKPFKRDDLIMTGFSMMSLLDIEFPWANKGCSHESYAEYKSLDNLSKLCNPSFVQFFEYLYRLDFKDVPDYNLLSRIVFL